MAEAPGAGAARAKIGRYIASGLALVVLDYLVFLALKDAAGMAPVPAQACARAAGALAGFLVQRAFVFRAAGGGPKEGLRQGSRYAALTVFNIFLSAWLLGLASTTLPALSSLGAKILVDALMAAETYALLHTVFSRDRRPPSTVGSLSGLDRALATAALIVVYAAILSAFDLRLLFSDTILTGGDSASWYQVLHKLKTSYLPALRLFGYSQSNFFGYMEGQQYFPLPFLAAALSGYAMPLTVALKLATMAGGLALPLTMYAGVRSVSGSLRAGLVAAGFSTLFLFNESYTMFGGNWLSTFAGEFCYSWALAILPLFIASVVRDSRGERTGFGSGILLGLIGMSHLFVFMPAFFLPFFPAFGEMKGIISTREDGRADARRSRLAARIGITYATAFCLMGFWFLPMAATRGWAQSISMIWHFASTGDFARQTLAWVWIPSSAFFAVLAFAAKPGAKHGIEATGRLALFFAYGVAACAFLFAVAPGLGMPDIRFVPTALVLCMFGVAALLPALLPALVTVRHRGEGRIAMAAFATLALVAACSIGARLQSRNAGAWFRWNYSGYEAKAQWPALAELSRRYSGDTGSGRILWEKQNQRDNADFGSERAFENLELFTGRPSTEGIHYGSSFMARSATYLQSAYSLNPVDPEAERIYSLVAPESWPARFRQANARHIITYSPEITAMFAAHPDFRLDTAIGKFSVFEFRKFPGSYIEIPDPGALGVVKEGPGGWKTDYYRFFRDWDLMDRPFVSTRFLDPAKGGAWEGARRPAVSYDDYATMARDGGKGAASGAGKASADSRVSGERVGDFSVRFTTAAPGMPHIVKMSYAPGWKSSGGEKIYPVAPGFMMMVPGSHDVRLEYRRTGWEIAGILLTLAGTLLLRVSGGWIMRRRLPWRIVFAASFIVFAASAGFLAMRCFTGPAAISRDISAARRLNLADPFARERAARLVGPWATPAALERYDNMLSFDAFRIKAEVLAREGRKREAAALITLLRERYPGTRPASSLPSY